jgi:hypothetical protein
MPDYSLVPVDYQPDFGDYSLVPVDHDPFAEDGVTPRAQIQQAQAQPQGPPQQQPATGAGQPDPGAPAAGGGPSGSEGGGIGPTGGAPNPTLDQGAAKAAPFGGYSLVPVDYQPDFGDYSLVPVDYNPFADGITQQGQAQPAQIQPQMAQPQPQNPPPPAGAGQPDVGAPVIDGGPSGSQGGNGLSPGGSDAGASERVPFSGFANPTPAESLVNRQKMKDQMELAGADRTGNNGAISDGGETYGFVTTGPTRRYLTSDQTGEIIMATSPFYAYDGTRYAFIDASPARPLTVTIRGDGTFTISRP